MSPDVRAAWPDTDDGHWDDAWDGEWEDAETRYRGLFWVTFWTVAGTLLPGTGLVVAGFRRIGAALFGIALALAVWAVTRGDELLARLPRDLDPDTLLNAAAAVGAAGVVLVLLLVGTNVALMRHTARGNWTRAGNRTLVVLLAGAIAVPAYGTVINLLLTRASLLAALSGTPLG